ncbi:phospholipase-like protein, partial [Tanacetum coccineum]
MDNFFDAKPTIGSRMRLIKDIKKLLEMNSNSLSLFSNSCFGVWLNVPFKDHDPFLIHSMLLNQQNVDEYHTEYYDIQFNVYNYILKFVCREFCICTGLKFGHYDLKPFDSALVVPFRDRVFGHANITVHHLKEAFDGDEWHNIDDVDVVHLCLVMFVEFVLLGREPKNNTHVHLLALVEDLDTFNQFLWGSYTWSALYKSIRNAAWIHYHCVTVGDGAGKGGGKVRKLEKLKKVDLKVMVTRLENLESRMNGYDLNKNGGYCDRDIRMDSGVGMQDHIKVDTDIKMDTVVRMDTGFRMSSGGLMDSSVGEMPDLNFYEGDAMDDCNFGLNSGWLNSMSTPQGQFWVFSTPSTQVNMAPQFQDLFIRPVHNSTTIREQHVDV